MNSSRLGLLGRAFSLVRVFPGEKREFSLVSIGGAFRLNLRQVVHRLASVNNFLFYYFQWGTCCLWYLVSCHTDLLPADNVLLTDTHGHWSPVPISVPCIPAPTEAEPVTILLGHPIISTALNSYTNTSSSITFCYPGHSLHPWSSHSPSAVPLLHFSLMRAAWSKASRGRGAYGLLKKEWNKQTSKV